MKTINYILAGLMLVSVACQRAHSQTPSISDMTEVTNAYAVLFDDTELEDRALTIRNRNGNVSDMNNVISDNGHAGFGDKASSAKWHIPRGWALVLYEDKGFKKRQYPLIGTGFLEERNELKGFSDDCSSAAWREVGYNYTFSAKISPQHRQILLQQQRLAYNTIFSCSRLGQTQKERLLRKYWDPIAYDITTNTALNGWAYINGQQVFVNTNNLIPVIPPTPNDLEETSQTLIHEMMHCAGYIHPDRTANDVPLDEGPYYSSPPLQAEICIAGDQSRIGLGSFLTRYNCIRRPGNRYEITPR